MENTESVLSVNNQLLIEMMSASAANPAGSFGVIELIKKYISDGGKAVLYDKLSGRISNRIELDDNRNFKFTDYKS